jgi:ABC-2 type transport system ATP-binding protein
MTVPPGGASEPAAVSCRGFSYRFGPTQAVTDLDLTVHAGEVFGLLGPNGAGKTTTIRALVTLLPLQAGEVQVFGHDVRRRRMRVRQLIGYVPQQLSADGTLSGRANVTLFARLFDVPRRQRRARVDEVLELMGLAEAAGRPAGSYSGGMVRRLELAQALVNRPRLLVLDEPTLGLDPVARATMWEQVAALRARYGTTVLATTHYLAEADQHCDRIGVMHRGRLRAVGAPAALKAELPGEATLDDVFRHHAGDRFDERGDFRDVRSIRRSGRRLG